jgi:putative membrane protein
MKKILVLGLAPAFALAACGGGNETANTTTANTAADNMTGEGMPTEMDANATGNAMAAAASPAQTFANEAGASDFYEIEAGKLAQEKAQAQGLKDFGKMMVEHHSMSTEKLKAAGGKASPAIVPSPVLNAEQEANLATLRAAQGAAFDTAYKAQQVVAHEKALALMQGYASTGEVPELKTFASQTQKVVQAHLTKIKGM